MKGKLLVLASFLTVSMLLSACGGEAKPDGGSGDNVSSQASGGDINLPYTSNEAINKFYQLAQTQGFEITLKSEDDESNGPETVTMGYKDNVFWVKEEIALKKDGNSLETYDYNPQTRAYVYQGAVTETADLSMESMMKQYTASFYIGYQMVDNPQLGYLSSEKDITYLGRNAKEYTYSYKGLDGQADVKVVFDKDTGITLKVSASASAGGESGSASYEVTSFVVGSAVKAPTLNKGGSSNPTSSSSNPGGQSSNPGSSSSNPGSSSSNPGGSSSGQGDTGETGEDNKFIDHVFKYVSHTGEAGEMIKNSVLSFFAGGTFELYVLDNGVYNVLLGDCTFGEDNNVVTLNAKKAYDGASQSYMANPMTLVFKFESNQYVLSFYGAVVKYALDATANPTHVDLPADPNEYAGADDAKYLVNKAIWDEMIVGYGIISLSSNFQVENDTQYSHNKYQFDNGKVRVETNNDEMYYEFTSLETGYFYCKDNYNAWIKDNSPMSFHQRFDDVTGILPIPFEKMTYNSASHSYGCSSWKDEQNDTYTNPRFYFENNNLIKITYTHWNENFEYRFDGYGQMTVTLPTVGGGDHPTQEQLDALLKNKVFVYNSFLLNDPTYEHKDKVDSYFTGNTVSFFDDGSFEVVYKKMANYDTGEIMEKSMVYIGSYQVKEQAANTQYHQVVLTVNKAVVDGVLVQDNLQEKISTRYTPNENKMTIWEYYQDIVTYYTLDSSLTPEHIKYTDSQTSSKWPAEEIAKKLQTLGLNVTLPKPTSADANIVSVTNEIAGETLKVVITLDSETNAQMELYGYIPYGSEAFTMDYMNSDFENNIFVYISANKEVKLTLSISGAAVTIIVEKNSASAFPAEAIAAYLEENDIAASFPDLTLDNVSYDFSGNFNALIMSPLGENTAEDLMGNLSAIFMQNSFKVMYMEEAFDEGGLSPMYIDPTMQYYVAVMNSPMNDGNVWAFIYPASEDMVEEVFFRYPEQLINATVPEDVTDTLPSFNVPNAVYRLYESLDGYELEIHIQPNTTAERSMTFLIDSLTNAGYTPQEDGSYLSANGQISVELENIDDLVIFVTINYLTEEVPEDVVYAFNCVNDWFPADENDANSQLYVYVWDSEGNYEWIEVENRNGKQFTLELSADWVGCKVVRFAPDSEIAWKEIDGEVNENVTIWNETGDIELPGVSDTIDFIFLG